MRNEQVLTAYYSLGGNTKKIAQMICRVTGGELAEIQMSLPYTGSYNEIVSQGQEEVNRGYLPELKPFTADLSAYDKIILGTPVWWYTFAPAMHTFLQGQDWAGKEVYPFATNGGWLGHTFQDFEAACSKGQVHPGLNVKFNGKTLKTPQEEIIAWAKQIAQ